MMNRLMCFGCYLLFMLMSCTVTAAGETDVVHLRNGDRVTGEIKSLFWGRLEFKTDHMGTLLIDWEDIQRIASDTGQSVELTNGQRFYGPLEKPDTSDMMVVSTEKGPVGLSVTDVTNMYPVKATWWERVDVSFKVGFNWDKSSDVGKYNLGVDAVYRHPDFISRAGASAEFTTQSSRSTTTRASANLSHLVFNEQRRFRTYFGNFDHNEALGLQLRTLLGLGYGWIPVRTNRTWFSTMVGLAVNRERPVDGREASNLEGVIGATYEYFKYPTPKKSLTSDLVVYPSLSESGRVRAEFNTNFDIEIVNDFFWDLEFYTSYDSEPVTEDAESIDYGINSSVAYKF
ncbi:MAG: DUF481 domain-containing protein [Xanthomonadales bacterium]|nr:DUF481 domain-containing protein [Xanthomonadales bacterium]